MLRSWYANPALRLDTLSLSVIYRNIFTLAESRQHHPFRPTKLLWKMKRISQKLGGVVSQD